MAVTLQPDDLLYPQGDLRVNLFPDGNAVTTIAVWLAEAADKVAGVIDEEQNVAATHRVYFRAYDSFAKWIASQPAREEYFNEVRRDWLQNKAEYWRQEAQRQLQAFEQITATTVASSTALFALAAARRRF